MRFDCKRTDVNAWTGHDDYSVAYNGNYDMFEHCSECAITYTEGLSDRATSNDGDGSYFVNRGIRCAACKPDYDGSAGGTAKYYYLVRDRCFEKADLSSVCYSAGKDWMYANTNSWTG